MAQKNKLWIGFVVLTPCALAIAWFAIGQFQRAKRLGDTPAPMTTADALREAGAGERWVLLSDAKADCKHSVMVGDYRYAAALAPDLPADAVLVLSHYTSRCPKPPFDGVVQRMESTSRQRDLAEQGISAAAVWELAVVAPPKEARSGAWLLVGMAVVVQLLAFVPYLARRQKNRILKVRPPAMPRETLIAALSAGPQQFRRSFLARRFIGATVFYAVLLLFCAGLLALAAYEVSGHRVLDASQLTNLVLFAVGTTGAWSSLRELRRLPIQRANFRAAARAPKMIFVPLEKTTYLTQRGMMTGRVIYSFRAPNGRTYKQQIDKPQEPVFGETRRQVMVVTAQDYPDAEPVLVADDGYPFDLHAT